MPRKCVNIDLGGEWDPLQRIARLCGRKHSTMAGDLIRPIIRHLAQLNDEEIIAEGRRWLAGDAVLPAGAARDDHIRSSLKKIEEKLDQLVPESVSPRHPTGADPVAPAAAVSGKIQAAAPSAPSGDPGGAPAPARRQGSAEPSGKPEAPAQPAPTRPQSANAVAGGATAGTGNTAPPKPTARDSRRASATSPTSKWTPPPRPGAFRRLAKSLFGRSRPARSP